MDKPVAAYLRLSQTSEDSVSIEGQRRLATALAESRGWPTPSFFVDDGVSGSRSVKRPGRDELEARIGRGEFGALIVKSVDRLARSSADFARIAAASRQAGCALVVVDLGFDTTTPVGEMVVGILAQFAQFEARLTSARVTTSNEVRLTDGRAIGGPVPYGFRNAKRAERPGVYRVVDEDQAANVRDVCAQLLAGSSLHAIARRLHERDVPPPRVASALRNERDPGRSRWDYAAVRRVLTNPAVAGMQRRRGDLVRDPATGLPRVSDAAILTVADWRGVQDAIEARSTGPRTRTLRAERLLLDGLARCAGCGGFMRRTTTRGGGTERYESYGCQRRGRNDCEGPAFIKAATLDDFVVSEYLRVFGRFDVVEHREVARPEITERLALFRSEAQSTSAAIACAPPAEIAALAERLVSLRTAEEAARREADAEPLIEQVRTGQPSARHGWPKASTLSPAAVSSRASSER